MTSEACFHFCSENSSLQQYMYIEHYGTKLIYSGAGLLPDDMKSPVSEIIPAFYLIYFMNN